MPIEIFNRQELKFIISRRQYVAMMPAISQHMRLDKHNAAGAPYRLYNLYIDTADRALIRHSMTKPAAYKEKLRIRSYAPLHPGSRVFLEIKKRYKKITNKRRTQMVLRDAVEFVRTGTPPILQDYMNQQVVSEIGSMLGGRRYQPTAHIDYDRMAFHALDAANDLRLTFDTRLVSRQYRRDEVHCLLEPDKLIMEVKSTANMPLWLVELLDRQGIYKQSFSKYGAEHTRLLQLKSEAAYA